ncbi:MAG: ABC transporter permease subunit [Rhodobacterales bacterium]|nr:ABC transporter permease subunit [Rhodobacterales bacterium]
MSRILHIAKREWLEQRRQPAMLGVIASLYLMISAVALLPLVLLQIVSNKPNAGVSLARLVGGEVDLPMLIETASRATLIAFNLLMFSQFLGIAAVMAGHAVLHDRQCGTLTFLLLSPLRRLELFTGKVIGAIGQTYLLYMVISGGTSLIMATFPFAVDFPTYTPRNPAWWVAFLFGGPAWGMFIATVCTIVSSVSHDVRTSQQAVWFVMFFGQMLCGVLLTDTMASGVVTELAVALIGVFSSAIALYIGSQVFRRDLGR